MNTIKVILLQACLSTAFAAYYEETFVTIEPDSLARNDSNFGFSMTYFIKQLIISAPTANNIGQLFNYDIDYKKLRQLYIDVPRENNFSAYTHNYWLGAFLTSTESFVVTCAPRSMYEYKSDLHVTRGVCFKINDRKVEKLPNIHNLYLNLLNGGIDGFGWSIDIDNKNNIMMGGHTSHRNISGVRINENINNTYQDAQILPINKYIINMGYSVISGNFLSDTQTTYAISSTFGIYGSGKVYFMDESRRYDNETLDGDVGASYGSILGKVRLGGNRHSLLVGAPSADLNGGYDKGAVYLYVPDYKAETKSKLPKLKTIINGTVSGGYFGAALVSIGDLDGDNLEEIAIGAPYEGKGAVYIYTGHSLLLGRTWQQKIQPEEHSSFGFSLTPLNHAYNVGCNELAVGAPLSNRAFIFKCIPVVTAKISTIFPKMQDRKDKTYFEFGVCVDITYPKQPEELELTISLKIEIIHSYAHFEKTDDDGFFTHDFSLRSGQTKDCYEKIKVLTPRGNYEEFIKINITGSLQEPDIKTTMTNIVVSDRSVLALQRSVWAADCKEYGRCKPELTGEIQASFSKEYHAGVEEMAEFSVILKNTGEVAYDACVEVFFPAVYVLRAPPACAVKTPRRVVCKPNDLPSGRKWSTGFIEVDTTSLTNEDENLEVQYSLYNHCTDEDPAENVVKEYPLTYEYSNISVSGASNPNKAIEVDHAKIQNFAQFQHMYTVTNNGVLTYRNARCDIRLERKEYINYNTPIVTNIKGNVTWTSECTLKIVKNHVVSTCYLASLSKDSETNVFLSMDILPAITNYEKEENVTISSEMTLYILQNSIHKNVTTTLMLHSTAVPLWIWIVAVIIGLILLLILVAILYEGGCLKRKNKEQLENLKASRSNKVPKNENQSVRFSTIVNRRREEQLLEN